MITATKFADNLSGPLEIRQEIHDLRQNDSGQDSTVDLDIFRQLEERIDAVTRDYWIDTSLSLTEQFGDNVKRPLMHEDIPAVAATLCIQSLMAGAFPNFDQKHSQNLLDGNRANPEEGETFDINSLEATTIERLGRYIEIGEKAKKGEPVLLANSRQFFDITKPPQIEIQTRKKHGNFLNVHTSLTIENNVSATVKKASPIPIFRFLHEPQEITSTGALMHFKDVSKPVKSQASDSIGVLKNSGQNISIEELFILILAKQTGLVKRTPKDTINVEFAQNRILSKQDEDSINMLKSEAKRAGIIFELVHPKPPSKPVINGRRV